MRKRCSNFSPRVIAAGAGLLLGTTGISSAATVEFSFTGIVTATNGPGMSDLPASVVIGTVCHGRLAYVYNAINDVDPDTHSGIYNFPPDGLTMSLSIGNDAFTTGTNQQRTISVLNDAQQPVSDQLSYSASDYLINGAMPPGNLQSRILSIGLNTTNLSALTSDALPFTPPRIDDFQIVGSAGYRVLSCYSYRSNSFYYGFTVTIDNIIVPPELKIVRAGSQVQVSWPTNLIDYQLESSTNFAGSDVTGHWSAYPQLPIVDAAQFKVGADATNGMQWFRLRRLSAD
jgi:hypothetical protein